MEHTFQPQPLPLRLFLRIIKRTQGSYLSVRTVSGELYELEFVKNERLWKVAYNMGNGMETLVEHRRNPVKLIDRIEDACEVSVKQRQAAQDSVGVYSVSPESSTSPIMQLVKNED